MAKITDLVETFKDYPDSKQTACITLGDLRQVAAVIDRAALLLEALESGADGDFRRRKLRDALQSLSE